MTSLCCQEPLPMLVVRDLVTIADLQKCRKYLKICRYEDKRHGVMTLLQATDHEKIVSHIKLFYKGFLNTENYYDGKFLSKVTQQIKCKSYNFVVLTNYKIKMLS